MICRNCGYNNNSNNIRCVSCGHDLRQGGNSNIPAVNQYPGQPNMRHGMNPYSGQANIYQGMQPPMQQSPIPVSGYPGAPQPVQSVVIRQNSQPGIPATYEPLGMWVYFGFTLLFSIPFVGFIVALVLALGGTSNINIRNFARSQFCWLIILSIILLLLTLSGVTGMVLAGSRRW